MCHVGRTRGHKYKVPDALRAALAAYQLAEDLSDEEFGKRVGASHGTINNIKRGLTPSSGLVPAIAREIGYKLPEEAYPDDLRDLSARLAEMMGEDPEGYEAVKKHAEFVMSRKKPAPG